MSFDIVFELTEVIFQLFSTTSVLNEKFRQVVFRNNIHF